MIRMRLAACLVLGGVALLGSGCNGTGLHVLPCNGNGNGNGVFSRLNPFNRACCPTAEPDCCNGAVAPSFGGPVETYGGAVPSFDGPHLDPLGNGYIAPHVGSQPEIIPPVVGGQPGVPPVVDTTPRFSPIPQSHPMPYTP
jgi:hypothetical protein